MEQFSGILVQEEETIIWNPNSAQEECDKGTKIDTWNRDMKHSLHAGHPQGHDSRKISLHLIPFHGKRILETTLYQKLHNFLRIQRDFFTFFYDKQKKCMLYWLHRNSLVQTKCQSLPPLHYNTSCDSWQLTDVIAWWNSRFSLISKTLDRNIFLEKSVFTQKQLTVDKHHDV